MILTIGHSTRSQEEFVQLLQTHGVEHLVDVRTFPGSRRYPHFNHDSLARALADIGIGYTHLKGLGGRRRPRPDSHNGAWRNLGFRGYADYMQTPEFEENLQALLALAARECVAIMCAEAVPWRCHRTLIADALTVRGVSVEHILHPGRRQLHTLTSFAWVQGIYLTYPLEGG